MTQYTTSKILKSAAVTEVSDTPAARNEVSSCDKLNRLPLARVN